MPIARVPTAPSRTNWSAEPTSRAVCLRRYGPATKHKLEPMTLRRGEGYTPQLFSRCFRPCVYRAKLFHQLFHMPHSAVILHVLLGC